ncbi:uncharacterized protein V1518DRAFT_418463 [Limtongia smithiae]|uniref:uncharacterized protein n=1 Tax=Limtongia smithiae TaxID=1125753 RepID=UPI0034CFEE32
MQLRTAENGENATEDATRRVTRVRARRTPKRELVRSSPARFAPAFILRSDSFSPHYTTRSLYPPSLSFPPHRDAMLTAINNMFSSWGSASSGATVVRPVQSGSSSAASSSNPYFASAFDSTTHLTPPTPVYTPGMRSFSTVSLSADLPMIPAASPGAASGSPTVRRDLDDVAPGTPGASSNHSTIQLQDFRDGMPPAPPVALSLSRIARWAERNYPELYDNINFGALAADVDALERATECVLPPDVREYLLTYDGQERGGKPCGLIYGVALLDSDEIIAEWGTWRAVANAIEQDEREAAAAIAAARSSSSASSESSASSTAIPHRRRLDFRSQQTSVPEHAILPVYASTGWLPLAKDYCGNNIAVDMSPGPTGNWGQVILFGREFDRKYVIARSWAHFLAMLADDFEDGRWSVDEDSEELWFVSGNKIYIYFDVLKRRAERAAGHFTQVQQQKNTYARNPATHLQQPPPPRTQQQKQGQIRRKPRPAPLYAAPPPASSSSTNLLSAARNASTASLSLPPSPGIVSARLPRTPQKTPMSAVVSTPTPATKIAPLSPPAQAESSSAAAPAAPVAEPATSKPAEVVAEVAVPATTTAAITDTNEASAPEPGPAESSASLSSVAVSAEESSS